MKRILSLLVLAGLCQLGLGTASAQQATVNTANSYGTAGCGLGSLIFGAEPGMIQVLAATTNGSFYSQTFGITSGTSNCVDSGDPVVNVASFVETNREILAKDIARGSGETIDTLATLGGCGDSTAVGRSLQGNFSAIFPGAGVTDQQVSQGVITVLRSDNSLRCDKIL